MKCKCEGFFGRTWETFCQVTVKICRILTTVTCKVVGIIGLEIAENELSEVFENEGNVTAREQNGSARGQFPLE